MQTTADRLHEALADQPHRTSMAEVGRRAKILAVTVRTYFSGDRNPPLDVCMSLGAAMGVNGQWLFNGKGPKKVKEVPPPADVRDIKEVPLIDNVAAGKLTTPASQLPVHDVPLLAFADLGPGDFFATKVSGTSMDRVSPDGSIVVVNRNDLQLVSGRCYIFSLKGDFTYKRWQGGDPSYLEPFSTDAMHKPQFIRRMRDLVVVGRVKRTVLDL